MPYLVEEADHRVLFLERLWQRKEVRLSCSIAVESEIVAVTSSKSRGRPGKVREVFSLIWSDADRTVKLRLLTVLGLIVTSSAIGALGPVALKLIVDQFTHQTKSDPALPLALLGLYALSQWAMRVLSQTGAVFYGRAEWRMFRLLSERVFAHLMQLPLRFHLDRQTGAVAQTLNNGLQGYDMIMHNLVFTFLPIGTQIGTMIVILSHLTEPAFVALFCAALVCYATAFSYAAGRLSEVAQTACAAHVEANAIVTDGILNYETVKYFTGESILQNKVSIALARTEISWVNVYRRSAFYGLVTATVLTVFLGVTAVYASFQVRSGRMSIGDFVLVNTYMLQMFQPMEAIGYAVQAVSQGVAMLQKMLDLLWESPEQRLTDEWAPAAGPGRLEFENVALSYRPDRRVLSGVSFKISSGKTLGIVGASGSGKSSIVRLLVRFWEPDDGRILLDGVPISDLSPTQLRQAIAVVPQDTILFDETIGYNIAFGKRQSTAEEVVHAATLADLHDFVMNLPEKYDTRIGERGVKLSGGEKQRISIARAAIKRPRIYVFDEATSSLDSRTEQEILRNLKQISRFCTTLIIAHRLSTVAHADEILVLDKGVVVERGTHSSLLSRGGKYAALWEAQRLGPGAAA